MSSTANNLVDLNNAGFEKAGRWLVRGVTFSVARGEIVTLIGPNGSGKSTTAKMALGILRPSEGRAVRDPALKPSYVPQKIAIDWTLPLTVRRFMTLTERVCDKDLKQALESTGASHLIGEEVRTLSGGEFQRVMLARAIARKPDLLVLDEPVQGVDYTGEIAIYELIGRIRDTMNCGILLISHDLHVVMAATDQVICLNGHMCCQGTPDAVAESDEYRRLFGDRAAALAVYHHHHDHTHLPDGTVRHADGSVTDYCHPHDGLHRPVPETAEGREEGRGPGRGGDVHAG